MVEPSIASDRGPVVPRLVFQRPDLGLLVLSAGESSTTITSPARADGWPAARGSSWTSLDVAHLSAARPGYRRVAVLQRVGAAQRHGLGVQQHLIIHTTELKEDRSKLLLLAVLQKIPLQVLPESMPHPQALNLFLNYL